MKTTTQILNEMFFDDAKKDIEHQTEQLKQIQVKIDDRKELVGRLSAILPTLEKVLEKLHLQTITTFGYYKGTFHLKLKPSGKFKPVTHLQNGNSKILIEKKKQYLESKVSDSIKNLIVFISGDSLYKEKGQEVKNIFISFTFTEFTKRQDY